MPLRDPWRRGIAVLLAAASLMLGGPAGGMLGQDSSETFWFDPLDEDSAWTLVGGHGTTELLTDDELTVLRLSGGTQSDPARLLSPSLDARGPVNVGLALRTEHATQVLAEGPILRFLDADGGVIGELSATGSGLYLKGPDGYIFIGNAFWGQARVWSFALDGTSVTVAPNSWTGYDGFTVPATSANPLDRIELVSPGVARGIDLVTVSSPGAGLHDSFLPGVDDAWPADWRLVTDVGQIDPGVGPYLVNHGSPPERSIAQGAHGTYGHVVLSPHPTLRTFAATATGWSTDLPTEVHLAVRPDQLAPMDAAVLAGLDGTGAPTWVLSLTTAVTGADLPILAALRATTGPGMTTTVAEDLATSTDAWTIVDVETDPSSSTLRISVNGAPGVPVHAPLLAQTAEIAIGDVVAAGNAWGAGEQPGRIVMDEMVVGPLGASTS